MLVGLIWIAIFAIQIKYKGIDKHNTKKVLITIINKYGSQILINSHDSPTGLCRAGLNAGSR